VKHPLLAVGIIPKQVIVKSYPQPVKRLLNRLDCDGNIVDGYEAVFHYVIVSHNDKLYTMVYEPNGIINLEPNMKIRIKKKLGKLEVIL
jgi:hypothetical protein